MADQKEKQAMQKMMDYMHMNPQVRANQNNKDNGNQPPSYPNQPYPFYPGDSAHKSYYPPYYDYYKTYYQGLGMGWKPPHTTPNTESMPPSYPGSYMGRPHQAQGNNHSMNSMYPMGMPPYNPYPYYPPGMQYPSYNNYPYYPRPYHDMYMSGSGPTPHPSQTQPLGGANTPGLGGGLNQSYQGMNMPGQQKLQKFQKSSQQVIKQNPPQYNQNFQKSEIIGRPKPNQKIQNSKNEILLIDEQPVIIKQQIVEISSDEQELKEKVDECSDKKNIIVPQRHEYEVITSKFHPSQQKMASEKEKEKILDEQTQKLQQISMATKQLQKPYQKHKMIAKTEKQCKIGKEVKKKLNIQDFKFQDQKGTREEKIASSLKKFQHKNYYKTIKQDIKGEGEDKSVADKVDKEKEVKKQKPKEDHPLKQLRNNESHGKIRLGSFYQSSIPQLLQNPKNILLRKQLQIKLKQRQISAITF